MMEHQIIPVPPIFSWFTRHCGTYDDSAIGLQIFPDTGRGAVALRDINEGEVLFQIPRDLVLSTRTSGLLLLLSEEDRKTLGKGWASLILCMMWEEAKGSDGKWFDYLADMPTSFSTPMFWTEEELSELKGSSILDKVGRADAEADYHNKVLPIIKSRPDLFDETSINELYSIDRYHINGSRILSRSFHIEKWDGNQESDQEEEMEEGDQEPEDDEGEDTADVGMTPFADLLNACYGCDNARLFYEEHTLNMTVTKHIPKGSQIWNTYGDPPNGDLLRRYGHVDVIQDDRQMFNPADDVEIRADLVIEVIAKANTDSELQERVDYFLEEGGEDVFVLDASEPMIPDDFVQFVRLLQLNDQEWIRIREKETLPKPKVDPTVLEAIRLVLDQRLQRYPTTIEADRGILGRSPPPNLRNAVIVRLGEKLILTKVLQFATQELDKMQSAGRPEKRKKAPSDATASSGKKSRQKA